MDMCNLKCLQLLLRSHTHKKIILIPFIICPVQTELLPKYAAKPENL